VGELYATYCSAEKRTDAGEIPARLRYRSSRIDAVCAAAQAAGCRAAILSGQFGLIAADALVPWYDHLLQEAEIQAMSDHVAVTLTRWEVDTIRWFTVDPALDPHVHRYRAVMDAAAHTAGAAVNTVLWTP
jgi:hypothetical protein